MYQEALTRDSLMNSIQLGVAFSKENSQSFNLKDYKSGTFEYNALYKANGTPNYAYNSETNISKVSMEYWLKPIVISINLNDKWEIDYKKSKIIDGYKCYYAIYTGKGLWWELNPEKPTYAWFTTEIPLPFGPLQYNGLPGLIIEMNVDNIRYTATKIGFDDTYASKLESLDFTNYEVLSEQDFINTRNEIRRRAKRIITGN
jgi:GLPGLI family protein